MALPTTIPTRKLRAHTASAAKLEPADTPGQRRRTATWQKRALDYVDLVPECNYGSRFYSRMLKRIHIYPATRGTDDKLTAITTGAPVDILDRIQDPGGGRSGIQGSYGRLMFITGEGYLFGRDLNKEEEERWAFVWNEEIEIDEQGNIIHKPTDASDGTKYAPGDAVAYRMWTPHPKRSGEAESPMKSVLEIAEELLVLTKGVRATAVSRMLNGMVKVPSELSFGPAEGGADEDPEANIFLADLIEHITGVVENAGSAEAASPFIAEGAAEFLEQLEWIALHDPQTDYMERELRKEAVQRLAFGFDFPPEVLTGLSGANHWTGKQIVHDMWRSHGVAVAEQFCDDIAEAYLKPALKEDNYQGWEKVVVGFDDSEVVVAPDRSEDADRAFDRGNLSRKGYRKLKGIDEDMKPDDEEHAEWLAVKMRDPQMLPEGFRPPPERGPDPAPPDERDPEEGPPEPGPEGVSRPESRTASAMVVGAAHMAIARCREVAGARLRSHAKPHPEVFSLVDGLPNSVVAFTLTRDRLSEAGIEFDALALCRGGTDMFRSTLETWGYSKSQRDSLAEMVLVYAAKTLFDSSPPLPPGIRAQVERMKEVSDAVASS